MNVSIPRFCYLQTCGCVFSDRALKEIKTDICHKVRDVAIFFPVTLFQLGHLVVYNVSALKKMVVAYNKTLLYTLFKVFRTLRSVKMCDSPNQ